MGVNMPVRQATPEECMKDLERRAREAEKNELELKQKYDRAIFHIKILNDLVFVQKSLIAEYQKQLNIIPKKEFEF